MYIYGVVWTGVLLHKSFDGRDLKSRWRMACTFYEILCSTHPSVCTDNGDEVSSRVKLHSNAALCVSDTLLALGLEDNGYLSNSARVQALDQM